MKKIITMLILMILLFTVSCTGKVSNAQWDAYKKACEPNGSIDYLEIVSSDPFRVHCKNKASFYTDDLDVN